MAGSDFTVQALIDQQTVAHVRDGKMLYLRITSQRTAGCASRPLAIDPGTRTGGKR